MQMGQVKPATKEEGPTKVVTGKTNIFDQKTGKL